MAQNVIACCKSIRNLKYPVAEWPGVIFERAVLDLAGNDRVLLEVGGGRDARFLKRVAPRFGRAIGVDLEVVAQPAPGENWVLIRGDAHDLQVDDASVDVVAMQNVVEHLEDPVRAFRECARVLRPGGVLCISTVNRWFPPIVLGRLLPHGLRQKLNRTATGTREEDTFAAYYRANSGRALARAASAAGFRERSLMFVSSHPQYLMFSVLAYRIGIALERVVRRWELLRGIRHFIQVTFEKPKQLTPDPCRNSANRSLGQGKRIGDACTISSEKRAHARRQITESW